MRIISDRRAIGVFAVEPDATSLGAKILDRPAIGGPEPADPVWGSGFQDAAQKPELPRQNRIVIADEQHIVTGAGA